MSISVIDYSLLTVDNWQSKKTQNVSIVQGFNVFRNKNAANAEYSIFC